MPNRISSSLLPALFIATGTLLLPLPAFATPDILVFGFGGIGITSGQTTYARELMTDFGSIQLGNTREEKFAINNRGTTLTLETPAVTVLQSGTDFSVIQPPVHDVGSDLVDFKIDFAPAGPGVHSAIISVNSNDPDTPHYTFAIRGFGITVPPPPYVDLSLYSPKSKGKHVLVNGQPAVKFTGKIKIQNFGTTGTLPGHMFLNLYACPTFYWDQTSIPSPVPLAFTKSLPAGSSISKSFKFTMPGTATSYAIRVYTSPDEIETDYSDNLVFEYAR